MWYRYVLYQNLGFGLYFSKSRSCNLQLLVHKVFLKFPCEYKMWGSGGFQQKSAPEPRTFLPRACVRRTGPAYISFLPIVYVGRVGWGAARGVGRPLAGIPELVLGCPVGLGGISTEKCARTPTVYTTRDKTNAILQVYLLKNRRWNLPFPKTLIFAVATPSDWRRTTICSSMRFGVYKARFPPKVIHVRLV